MKNDNVLKSRIVDIKRFAVHDGPGTRTTIFFKGCSLKCLWCHNPETIDYKKELCFNETKCQKCMKCLNVCDFDVFSYKDGQKNINRYNCSYCSKCINTCPNQALKVYGEQYTSKELLDIVIEDKDFFDISGGGVTLSGGEPLLQSKFATLFLEECKKNGIHTAVDTCGNVEFDKFLDVVDNTDLFLYDIKHIDSKLHKKYTGCGNELILENINKLSKLKKPIEVRMIVLPGINTEKCYIKSVGKFLKNVSSLTRIKLLEYHDYARSKYISIGKIDTMPYIEKPNSEIMDNIKNILCSYGHDVYID